MADSLGSLVDKLAIVNIKLWFTQDEVHKAAAADTFLTANATKRLVDLNLKRTKLMTEIDQKLADAVESGKVDVDPRHKLT